MEVQNLIKNVYLFPTMHRKQEEEHVSSPEYAKYVKDLFSGGFGKTVDKVTKAAGYKRRIPGDLYCADKSYSVGAGIALGTVFHIGIATVVGFTLEKLGSPIADNLDIWKYSIGASLGIPVVTNITSAIYERKRYNKFQKDLKVGDSILEDMIKE